MSQLQPESRMTQQFQLQTNQMSAPKPLRTQMLLAFRQIHLGQQQVCCCAADRGTDTADLACYVSLCMHAARQAGRQSRSDHSVRQAHQLNHPTSRQQQQSQRELTLPRTCF